MSTATLAVDAARAIQSAAPGFAPRLAIVLGSGLGPLADVVVDAKSIPYGEIPGFPAPGVSGHAGTLVLGQLGGQPVACLKGRAHAYEGRGIDVMKVPVRAMRLIGCEAIYLTCAAGSLRQDIPPGGLMMFSDHLNLLPGNPLAGPNDDDFGPRFPSLEDAYDPRFRKLLAEIAAEQGVDLAEGVYAALMGPSFETPAEIRMLQTLGADAVGMSTVPECILARHCGLQVIATAAITNYGVGMSDEPVDHDRTLAFAAVAGESLGRLIIRFLERIDDAAGPA